MPLNLDCFTITQCLRCRCLMGTGDPELARVICAECRLRAAEERLLAALRDGLPKVEP